MIQKYCIILFSVVMCDRLDENLVSSFSPCSRDMPKFLSELRVASGTISMRNFLEKKKVKISTSKPSSFSLLPHDKCYIW